MIWTAVAAATSRKVPWVMAFASHHSSDASLAIVDDIPKQEKARCGICYEDLDEHCPHLAEFGPGAQDRTVKLPDCPQHGQFHWSCLQKQVRAEKHSTWEKKTPAKVKELMESDAYSGSFKAILSHKEMEEVLQKMTELETNGSHMEKPTFQNQLEGICSAEKANRVFEKLKFWTVSVCPLCKTAREGNNALYYDVYNHENRAHELRALGREKQGGIDPVDEVRYNQEECYRQALAIDENDAKAWFYLAEHVKEDTIFNGRRYSKLDCYRRALTTYGELTAAWKSLGCYLYRNRNSSIPELQWPINIRGETIDREGMKAIANAIQLNLEHMKVNNALQTPDKKWAEVAKSWKKLGEMLKEKDEASRKRGWGKHRIPPEETIMISGKSFTASGCFIRSLELNSTHYVYPVPAEGEWRVNRETFSLWWYLATSSPHDPRKEFAVRTRADGFTRGEHNQLITFEEWNEMPDAQIALQGTTAGAPSEQPEDAADAPMQQAVREAEVTHTTDATMEQVEQQAGSSDNIEVTTDHRTIPANAPAPEPISGEEWHKEGNITYLTQRGCLIEALWVLHEGNDTAKVWLELATSLYRKGGCMDTDTELTLKSGQPEADDYSSFQKVKITKRVTARHCIVCYLQNCYLRIDANPANGALKVYSGKEFDKPVMDEYGMLVNRYRRDLETFARVWKQLEMDAKRRICAGVDAPEIEIVVKGRTFSSDQDYEDAAYLVWNTMLQRCGQVQGIFVDLQVDSNS